jgi:hypothetical protein
MEPLDPEGTLRHEWVNGRGAIARFDRGTIEIRVVDPQECAAADLSVVRGVARVLQDLTERILEGDTRLGRLSTVRLADVLDKVVRDADHAIVDDGTLLEAMGLARPGRARRTVDIWIDLIERSPAREWEGSQPERDSSGADPLTIILEKGSLARRILSRTGEDPDRPRLLEVFSALADSLRENRVFLAD